MARAQSEPLCVMLVAAETSGDALGAKLAQALRAKLGDRLTIVGVGGARMAAEGIESPFDISDLSVLGLVEGLAAYPKVVRRVRDTVALAQAHKPDVAVLIDSWGFTLRVATALRRSLPGVKLVKYVGPQVWASRPGRARTLAGAVDHLLTLHSFDAPWFERHGLPVTFVGNAILARDFSRADPERLRAGIGAGKTDPILLVAPGSRASEVERMAPPLGDAIAILSATRPHLHVVVPVASSVAPAVRAAAAAWQGRLTLIEDDSLKDDAMASATAALACSGTVSTELALAGPPVVVGYRIGGLTYAVLKRIVTTPWISLVNVAAGRMVMPEFIQDRCTGANLARAVAPLLDDQQARDEQVAGQQAALAQMGRGGPDPSEAAALAVLKVVGRD
jgi:lipid-A-disaccharide synthase